MLVTVHNHISSYTYVPSNSSATYFDTDDSDDMFSWRSRATHLLRMPGTELAETDAGGRSYRPMSGYGKHWNSVHSVGCNPQGKDLAQHLRLGSMFKLLGPTLYPLCQSLSWPIRVLWVTVSCWKIVGSRTSRPAANSCRLRVLKGWHSPRRSHLCHCDQCFDKGQGLRKFQAVVTQKPSEAASRCRNMS